jgi:simple sugar transport system ATP-binding protein
VDVASKTLLLRELAAVTGGSGTSLLLATDELPDLDICDRVIVLVRGEQFAEFSRPPFDREQLIAATEGIRPENSSPENSSPENSSPENRSPHE